MRGWTIFVVSPVLLLVLQLSSPSLPASLPVSSLQACSALSTEAEALDCLEQNLARLPSGTDELSALWELVPEMPGPILELAMRRTASPGAEESSTRLRAAWLDLQGRALLELGRPGEAAERLTEALSFDDGTLRLTWLSPESGERWRSSLDPGCGRLQRTARGLVSAGRADDAVEPLGRALVLGAGGWAEDTWSTLGEGPPPGRSAEPAALSARKWFKSVPDQEIDLADGARFSLRKDGRGRVLVLSFWATWCLPCRDELPHIQALYESERESGLEVLGVNADEPMKVALPFARGLGLTFPIARGNKALYDTFDTRRLPVLAVVDRWGAVRGRWAGYEPGDEERLHSLALRLLTEQSPPSNDYGEILLGGERFEMAWLRPGTGSIEGLAVLPRSGDAAGLLVSAARTLTLYGQEGETIETWAMPAPVGQLRLSAPAEDGRVAALGFRPGSPALLSIDLPSGSHREWSAPAPVFDAAFTGPPGSETGPFLLLATLQGLWKSSPGDGPTGGEALTRTGASAVEAWAGGSAVLEFGGELAWREGLSTESHKVRVPAESWMLLKGIGPGAEVGVAPAGVRAAVAGRFLDRPGEQAALATDSGQLVILDLMSGETLFRARWEGISALAAGDLLGDARDELIVASGTDFGVLKAK